MNRLPDRTGIVVIPFCFASASWIASALLISGLFPGKEQPWGARVTESMLTSLAGTLGPFGVAVVALVMVVPATVWLVRALRAYRVQVAADRAAMR
jgi:hypothetical protein